MIHPMIYPMSVCLILQFPGHSQEILVPCCFVGVLSYPNPMPPQCLRIAGGKSHLFRRTYHQRFIVSHEYANMNFFVYNVLYLNSSYYLRVLMFCHAGSSWIPSGVNVASNGNSMIFPTGPASGTGPEIFRRPATFE